ncbi:MAG: ABC-F family ATP-binding cassette domain-containing protein [Eubacterium sp.]|nr:ABC-F family ATP-binding cassette domain-containing protein [Eubacterium sp.]
MTVMTVNDLSISFGGELLFGDVGFKLEDATRVGLVGVNGCGKTTLFKIINGELDAESGNVSLSAGGKIGYMEQYVLRDEHLSLYNEVLEIFRPLIELEDELAEINYEIDAGDRSEQTLTRQMRLREQFERDGGLTYKSRAVSALTGLGFEKDELDKPISALSGGQKSKAQLAKLLLSDSNILLLDEPTNHLDIKACEWLEEFLDSRKGAYIVISHDRYFLDRVTNTTFEIENGRLTVYKGNYTRYLDLKAEAREAQQRVYDRTVKEISRIEGIIEQQKRWNQAHNYVTAASKQKAADKLKATLDKPDALPQAVKFSFKCRQGGGNDVLYAEGLAKSFGGKKVFSGAGLDVKKNETVFILGENGCGKTTLLKILTGRLDADSGKYRFGADIEYGYYDQTQSELSGDKTALDEVWDTYPRLTETEVRTAMAAFLFKGEDVFKQVQTLSGGEKARLALLKLMLRGANLLLLDEPTNHLDIRSREALENALSDYGGTLLIISHDRYLINKLADRVVCLTENGTESIDGDYDRYLELYADRKPAEPEKPVKKENDYKLKKQRESERRKLRTAIERAEAEIERLGEEIEQKTALLSDPEYATDYEKAAALSLELEQLHQKESELTDRWAELSEEEERLGSE